MNRLSNIAFSVTVISIYVSDMLYCIYLCIIQLTDRKFSKGFILQEEIWRHSQLCFILFGIAFWFIILTQ